MSVSSVCVHMYVFECLCVSGIGTQLHYRLNLQRRKQQACPSAWAVVSGSLGTGLGPTAWPGQSWPLELLEKTATLLISLTLLFITFEKSWWLGKFLRTGRTEMGHLNLHHMMFWQLKPYLWSRRITQCIFFLALLNLVGCFLALLLFQTNLSIWFKCWYYGRTK